MKEDERVRKSRACLLEAMMQLLERKAFADISVTELCDRAGVSRMTFYRLYGRREDVLLDELDRLLAEVQLPEGTADAADAEASAPDFMQTMRRLLRIFEQNKRFLHAVFDADLDFHIIHRFEQLMADIDRPYQDNPKSVYFNCFTAGGVYLCLRHWVMQDEDTSAGQLVSYLGSFTAPTAAELMAQDAG